MEKLYDKFCHQCKKSFQHTARNAKYCSEDCLAVSRKQHRGREKRRRGYRKNAVQRRAESMSRKQAREHGLNHMVQWPCQMCGKVHFLKDLQMHHRDGDPLNNLVDCSNFALLCEPCHHKADAQWRKELKDGKEISDIRGWTGYVERMAIDPETFPQDIAPADPPEEQADASL